jgi:signal transduction histidine kinase
MCNGFVQNSIMRLFRFPTSLRQKITVTYAVIGVLILGISLFTVEELKLVEDKVLRTESTSALFDSVLEVRRYERNFFLYAQEADYRQNLAYVAKTRHLLEGETTDSVLVAETNDIPKLREGLQQYSQVMQRYHDAPQRRPALQTEVRSAGQNIVAIAQNIVTSEHRAVRSLLSTLRDVLLISIGTVVVLVIAMGRGLAMSVVKPLKHIEEDVDAVSRDMDDHLTLASNDREIVSITEAFNNLLRELELRRNHLLRSEKLASLGTMLSGVAHELNNPLSNIWTSCQILQDDLERTSAEEQRVLLRQIDEQSVRARNIVRSLLDFARDREFVKERVTLRPLIVQTLRFLKGEVPAGVSIDVDVDEALTVDADKQRLQQVFLNLIKNAIDAVGEQGEVRVEARPFRAGDAPPEDIPLSKRCGVAGEGIEIRVRDNGPGIPENVLPRIFDPFFTTKDVGRGMGLGLFIVYEIIEEHDGCINAANAEDGGTLIRFWLPQTQPATEKEDA